MHLRIPQLRRGYVGLDGGEPPIPTKTPFCFLEMKPTGVWATRRRVSQGRSPVMPSACSLEGRFAFHHNGQLSLTAVPRKLTGTRP